MHCLICLFSILPFFLFHSSFFVFCSFILLISGIVRLENKIVVIRKKTEATPLNTPTAGRIVLPQKSGYRTYSHCVANYQLHPKLSRVPCTKRVRFLEVFAVRNCNSKQDTVAALSWAGIETVTTEGDKQGVTRTRHCTNAIPISPIKSK